MHEHDSPIERIRTRAHAISQRRDAGTPEDNWSRAEAELVAEEDALKIAIEAAAEEEAIILHAGHRNAFSHP